MGHGADLDEVESLISGQRQGGLEGHDAKLAAIGPHDADFAGADTAIGSLIAATATGASLIANDVRFLQKGV
jgi:hypothetical protein